MSRHKCNIIASSETFWQLIIRVQTCTSNKRKEDPQREHSFCNKHQSQRLAQHYLSIMQLSFMHFIRYLEKLQKCNSYQSHQNVIQIFAAFSRYHFVLKYCKYSIFWNCIKTAIKQYKIHNFHIMYRPLTTCLWYVATCNLYFLAKCLLSNRQ